MIRFRTFDELREFLRKDRDAVGLCPVRFINVDSLEMWGSVKKQLLAMSKKHICLSSYCSQEDTMPNMHRFTASIKAVSENVCVLPLSEFLRVNPSLAHQMIAGLLANEYPGNSEGKLRIYIPMYRMGSILQTFDSSDPRKKDSVLLLTTGEECDYSLTVIQNELQTNVIGNEIFGFQQYLQYWEQNPDQPLILHTGNAVYFEDNVYFDNVRVIVTSFDLLTAFYHLPSEYKKADGTEEDWTRLAVVVAKERSFEGACCHELLINRYTPKLYEKWASFDAFQKWLLWLWTKSKHPAGYLKQCISQSNSVEEFTTLLFCNIIHLLGNPEFAASYAERRELLQKMELSVPERFWRSIGPLAALDQLKVLTDLSAKERETIFATLKKVEALDQPKAVEILRVSYPALAQYLQGADDQVVEDLSDEMADYFAQYRWNKAANILPKAFAERVRYFSRQKGASVYALKARNFIVSEEYDDSTVILFADGMGVEYVNYIYFVLGQLKQEGYSIRIRVGYCNLPSTTKGNKDFLTGRRVVEELSDPDEMKHGKTAYPQTIENEMLFLDCLKEKVREAFAQDISRVILTTDHGTSRMAVLVRSTEFDHKIPAKGHTIYKYGRYCDGTDLANEIPSAIEYDNKLIFADYQRFDQRGAPIDETHGGASLEEWLVPIFIIDNSSARQAKTVITIFPPDEPFRPDSLTKMVTVTFALEGYSSNDVSVRVHGKKILCRTVESQYEFKYLPEKNESTVVARVYVGTDNIGAFHFFVKQGIAQNAKFDLI